ncbi:glycosyltransferase family 2 protein [Shewanella baltica]|uniref:glycosyltransferase family A protein n=1 Tax=Shewanella baltica TaxID=62322 RepID=UPI00217ECC1C|nr:glycosyltransferase family A protein [Shewanella baltica]MCS6235494.1 glycosyltransferase family 2 protein [Shewanella baltica]MCS6259593.1 glycosyltransferase family 2 protein [Shewanella baltica]MCS6270112.1 glycosyltransferase family 2 protein [Shewanella baltica]
MNKSTVSLVITSCNRFDLLEKTIESFLKYNTYPISQYIVIEDSHNREKLENTLAKFKGIEFTLIHNDPQLGQMKSIDRAYLLVTSEYIFHCEDDWEFYRSGFIEKSLKVLLSDEDIVTVWLREKSDTNGHSVLPELYSCPTDVSLKYQIMHTNDLLHGVYWHGFTLNPGLRRLVDYQLIAPIAQYVSESGTGNKYYELGFKAAILPGGSVRHIGYHRGIRYKPNIAKWRKDFNVAFRRFKSKMHNLLKDKR